MTNNIKHQWFFPHAPQKVWDYLTKQELLAQWLIESDFKAIVGHKFQFNTKPKIKLGFDGNIYCEVLEVVPLKRLSYSWKGGPRKGVIKLDSVVIWTLTPENNGTLLQLEHNGFKGMQNYISFLIMRKGWDIGIKKRFLQVLNKSK